MSRRINRCSKEIRLVWHLLCCTPIYMQWRQNKNKNTTLKSYVSMMIFKLTKKLYMSPTIYKLIILYLIILQF